MKINESGRSMIEMLGVLAIIGVLSVGGIAGYSKAMSKYRVNKSVDQISHIAANTRILYSSQTSYAGLDSSNATGKDIINKAKLFPTEMGDGSTAHPYTNPFQGAVSIKYSKRFNADTNKAFVLTYSGIPEEACVDLATLDWGTGSGGGLVALGINQAANAIDGISTDGAGAEHTGACAAGNGVICGGDAVMSVTDAVAACNKTDGNEIQFKFY